MLLFLLLALGRHTPVYSWFHRFVPGFDMFRYPEKYMAWFSGFTAVAAARTLPGRYRFVTRVYQGRRGGPVYLWGTGDPLLSGADIRAMG